mgnify:CR=1 FL=1
MYRTIKITAGMTSEYEIIWTNAPDELIENQLAHNNQLEESGKEIVNPYGFIEAEGYICNILGNSSSAENIDDLIIDKEFDYYDY